MCDYSLEHVASRPARVGELLRTTKFTYTCGFSSIDDPQVAVCLQPGTEIAFANAVRYRAVPFLPTRTIPETVARFRKSIPTLRIHITMLWSSPTPEIILLTHLKADQIATVIQLPVGVTPSSDVPHHLSESRENSRFKRTEEA